jgi:hypothetical protein
VAAIARRAWGRLSDPRRTYNEALVLRDLVGLRRGAARALQAARPRRTGSGTALFVSMTDNVHQLKLEGVLAKALQLDGYRPVVLTLKGARWAEPYLRSFGLSDFVYPDDYLPEAEAAEADQAAADFLAGDVSVQSLKALEFRGAHVGQQALSTLSRHFYAGRISLGDAAVQERLADILPLAMRSVVSAERLLDRVQPDMVLFIEKGYAGMGSIYDVALQRGANVIQMMAVGMHWRDALLFKRYNEETRRLHPASLSAETWARVREIPWTERHERILEEEFATRYGSGQKHPDAGLQEGKQVLPPDEVRARLGLDPAKKTVVLFSHILWDANLFFGDDLFEDQETWLVETVKAMVANPAVNWVVKLHPANLIKGATRSNDEEAIRDAVGELPPHVKLMAPDTDVNTYSLFPFIDAGITIRGTVGLELPCFGAPVLTAGTGRYSGMGFTNDSSSVEEYLGKLARIQDLPRLSEEETLLAKKHAYGLFHLRPFLFSSFNASYMGRDAFASQHPLAANLDVVLRTPRAVEEAEDLREFVSWAESDQLDYLRSLDEDRHVEPLELQHA